MHRRVRLLVVTSALLAAASAVGTWEARAQIPLPTTPTTSTTAPPPSSTTSTTERPNPLSTTTTTQPPPDTTTPPTSGPTPTDPSAPGPSTSAPGVPPADDDHGGEHNELGGPVAVPSEYQALMNSVKRSAPNSSQKLLDALAPLQDLGVSPEDAIALAFGRFPVAGKATFVDDWWFARSSPPFHLHQGTDIFAAHGTPVRSPGNGVLTRKNGGLGGLSVYVTEPDGTYYYMTHLSAIVPEQVEGQQVKVGDIVGYVGDTGNAAGGSPHLHFEIHMAPAKNAFLYPPTPAAPPAPAKGKKAPAKSTKVSKPQPVILGNLADPALYGRGGLPAMNPKPFLDQWLNEALANVPALIARLEAGRPRAIVMTGMLRRFSDGGGLFAAPATPPRSQLLWASSANPQGGTLQLAQTEAIAAAGEFDWALLARREEERLTAVKAADRWADAMLDPLTPRALRTL